MPYGSRDQGARFTLATRYEGKRSKVPQWIEGVILVIMRRYTGSDASRAASYTGIPLRVTLCSTSECAALRLYEKSHMLYNQQLRKPFVLKSALKALFANRICHRNVDDFKASPASSYAS